MSSLTPSPVGMPKTALVTGGSRGLGRSTVLNLVRRGVDVIFTYQQAEVAAQAVVAEAEQAGGRATALPLDVADSSGFGSFETPMSAVLSAWGRERLDYLVHNAGTSHHAVFDEVSEADLDALYAVHYKAPFLLTQRLLPRLNDGGRIVLVSSGLTRVTVPSSVAYASVKGAVEILGRYLAKTLGPRRIAVNTVAPGAIATDFSGGMVRDNPEVNRMVREVTALGRVGEPEDIGPMIAALLSEELRWINGQRIEVAGGLMI